MILWSLVFDNNYFKLGYEDLVLLWIIIIGELVWLVICGVCGIVMNKELLKNVICCLDFSFLGMYNNGFLVFRVVCSFFKFLKKFLLLVVGSLIVFMNSLVFILFLWYVVCVLIFFRILKFLGKLWIRFLYKFCRELIIWII